MTALVKVLLVLVLVGLAGYFLLGLRPTSSGIVSERPSSTPGGTAIEIDTTRAREGAAALGKSAAKAAETVKDTVNETGLTAKIKAKMALDDTVKALQISVTTDGSTVTLGGNVASQKEHDRAVALARETDGVTRVVDNLRVDK